jgi:hypothetical protein
MRLPTVRAFSAHAQTVDANTSQKSGEARRTPGRICDRQRRYAFRPHNPAGSKFPQGLVSSQCPNPRRGPGFGRGFVAFAFARDWVGTTTLGLALPSRGLACLSPRPGGGSAQPDNEGPWATALAPRGLHSSWARSASAWPSSRLEVQKLAAWRISVCVKHQRVRSCRDVHAQGPLSSL